jgi:23S rRNA pseudouridine2605 synthase
MITAGRVMVNGSAASLGQCITAADRVSVDGRVVRVSGPARKTRIIMYHKPAGELVTVNDPEGRPTVFQHLPRIRGGHWVAVGRLDFNTGGLLLFTDSGELANRLMHPRYELEREYAVRVRGELSDEQLEQLRRGVMLDDGRAQFDQIEARGGRGSNRWYEVVLRQGRNREVRRMFEAVGLTVSRLLRVRFGPFRLPPRLRRGEWRELESAEVGAFIQALDRSGEVEAPAALSPRRR